MPLPSDADPMEEAGDEGHLRTVKEPLDDDAFKEVCRRLIERARDHMDDDVLPTVRRSWDYYRGNVDASPAQPIRDPNLGDIAFEGSKIVMTECRDTVQSILPELLRVYLAAEHAVEFTPSRPEDIDGAEQATDYCNHVFRNENDGENLLVDAFLDWAVKFGAVKVWWEESERHETYPFDGLGEAELAILRAEAEGPGGDIVALEAEPYTVMLPGAPPAPQPSPPGPPAPPGPPMPGQPPSGPGPAPVQPLPPGPPPIVPTTLYRGRIVRAFKEGRERIGLIPQEEFLIDPDADRVSEALIVGQDSDRLVSEVVGLGIPYETVEAHIGRTRSDRQDTRQARREQAYERSSPATGDTAIDYVRVVEATVRLDRDGDGIAECYRIVAIGDAPCEIVYATADDDVGWFVASPYRIPHQPIGEGIVETVIDLQDLSTATMRGILNSLNRAINPREIVNDDDPKTYQDLLSWFQGPIRASRPGAVEVHQIPFAGQYAFPVLDLIDARRANRTGISAAGQGLDPDALKGQTLESAHAVVSAPQSRMELLVREFGIGLLRPIFKHLLKLSTRYQDRQKVIRLRNKWVPVDPRSWNASMDAMPRVGLGTGTKGERFLGLQIIAGKQEQLMATGSPLVTPMLYRNTLAAMAELAGEKDVGRYFAEVTPAMLQQAQAAAKQQQEEMIAQQVQAAMQMEQAKAQGRAQGEQVKAQLDSEAMVRAAQLKGASDQEIARIKGAQDAQTKITVAQAQGQIDRENMDYQFQLKRAELNLEAGLETAKIAAGERSGNGDLPEVT